LGTLLAVVLPPLVAVGAGALLLKYTEGSGGGVMGVGKSNARSYAQGKTGVKFADVAGVDEAKQELQEVVDFLKNSDTFVWDIMFTKSMFETDDMQSQHDLLDRVAALIDRDILKTTITENLGILNSTNLETAHKLLESGKSITSGRLRQR
jgi:hypothetical protein